MAQGDIDYDLFLKILKDYHEIRYLQLYGEGEPLLHPRFFSMARQAADRGIKVSTITNGSLLDAEKILASGLYSLHISLESASPGTFRKIRGGDLNNIVNNIRTLMRMRNEKKSATPYVGLAVTIIRETMNDLDRIFKLYQDLALDGGIIFQPLNEMNSYKMNYNDGINSQALRDSDLKDINKRLENNKLLKQIVKERRLESTYFQTLRRNFNPERDGCPWLQHSLFVNFQGHALPCSMIKDIRMHSFGRIGIDPKESILKKREDMKGRLLSGDIPKACHNCRTLDSYYKPGKMHRYLSGRKRS